MCLTGAGLRGIFLQKVIFHLQDQLEAQRHKCPLSKKLVLNIEYSLYAPEVIESRPITSDLRYILSSNILPSTCAIIFLNNVFSQI